MSKEVILGIVRHTLTFAGGILVAKGLLEQGVLAEIIGGVMTVVGGVWSVIDKTKKLPL
jgi:hypothetical protein